MYSLISSSMAFCFRRGNIPFTGYTCVAEPNAWPKSMPIMPPVSIFIMKLERWRSPIPRIQWLTHSKAWELMKWDRRDRKASGLLHIFRKALLEFKTEKNKKVITASVTMSWAVILYMQTTYFSKSLGTYCNTFIKLLTASARFAFLAKNKMQV